MHRIHEWDPSESALADLGELAGPLTHEINTLLHNLTLHLALLRKTQLETADEDCKILQNQIIQMTAVVRQFQMRRSRDARPALADVNAALAEAVFTLQSNSRFHGTPPIEIQSADGKSRRAEAVTLCLEPQDGLPPVMACRAELRRLWRFLLCNALRAVAPGGPPVYARTELVGNEIYLQIEDVGPSVAAPELPRIFDASQSKRQGICGLELAACRSIVRRLQGTLRADNGPAGGLILTASLHAAKT